MIDPMQPETATVAIVMPLIIFGRRFIIYENIETIIARPLPA